MIIQFSVENFRSIKDEQTLSLVKNSATEMPDNYFSSDAPSAPELLKTAVIYGANASGKSNVLKALRCMQNIVANSNDSKPGALLPLNPFAFDVKMAKEPTNFELILVVELPNEEGEKKPVKVIYGFSCDRKMVYEEWLSVYPKSREQAWFHRMYDDESGSYKWNTSSFFKGNKSYWQESTRENQLFLSVATHLNSTQLLPIYQAMTAKMPIIISNRIGSDFTKDVCRNDDNKRKLLVEFLRQAGIDVFDIDFRQRHADELNIPEDFPDELRQMVVERFLEDAAVFFIYKDSLGRPIEFELEQESDGTQKLFEFAMLLMDVMEKGNTIIIDELNNSLHPKLVQHLVRLFNSKNNSGNGQLIFTSHETSVLRQDLLRRDQIWFCEKNSDRDTALYPLTDFSPRKGREDVEEVYLHGRYGATPIIEEFYNL